MAAAIYLIYCDFLAACQTVVGAQKLETRDKLLALLGGVLNKWKVLGIIIITWGYGAQKPIHLQLILVCVNGICFVEVHIEQGPWLDEIDQALGVVTAINGSARFTGEVIGQASHAGTTPMGRRKDAAAAVAELILFAEQRASQDARSPKGPSVGTVGVLHVPAGSLNVVPGRCQFTLDLRAPDNAQRDALVADVKAALASICAKRGVRFTLEPSLLASAAPSDPGWQARWEAAVQATGLPAFKLPSGAGHDAMKLHEVMPQAMLFVRGGNAGISHNPLETITNDDAQLCVDAFMNLLNQL